MTDGKTPRVTAPQLRKAVERAGFLATRQSGSHVILRNSEGKRVTLPMHAGQTLLPKLVRAILRDAGLTADDLRDLL